jgi:hypothetical protein
VAEDLGHVTLATYPTYERAQRTVDYLADHEFPVEHLQIIGTDVRIVENVTGRLDYGRAALYGMMTGSWLGIFVALLVGLFATSEDTPGLPTLLLWGLAWGAAFGIVYGLIAKAATRGRRDFTSTRKVEAAEYAVTCAPGHLGDARSMLAGMPPST